MWMITHTIYLGERQYDKRWIDRMDRMNVYGLICRNHDKYIENVDFFYEFFVTLYLIGQKTYLSSLYKLF